MLGLRRSYAVAAYLAYALNRVGRPSVQITGLGGAIAEQAGAVGPRDLLIAISFPPYAADTLQVCEQVQRAGAKRLAITDGVLSPVARGAELVLGVNDAGLLGFRSLTSAMCLAQTLAMSLAFRRPRRGARAGRRGSTTSTAEGFRHGPSPPIPEDACCRSEPLRRASLPRLSARSSRPPTAPPALHDQRRLGTALQRPGAH